jgi:GT2 family glycosyltransferase
VRDVVVTALVPVGPHHPELLRRAVGSLLAQTDPRWEALVVAERAVHDEVAHVLADELGDPRVVLERNPRSGLPAALNHGMGVARTTLVAILLGDDLWAPEAVATLREHHERHPDADVLHSGRVFVDAGDAPISSPHPPVAEVALEDFVGRSPVKHLICWRREAGLAVGGVDERIRHHGPDDYDFPWTLAEHGARFHAVDAPLYLHRDHREAPRLTTHVPRSVQERDLRRILRKHGVPRARARARVREARRTYLRQALFRSRLDRFVKERTGFDARLGWREPLR